MFELGAQAAGGSVDYNYLTEFTDVIPVGAGRSIAVGVFGKKLVVIRLTREGVIDRGFGGRDHKLVAPFGGVFGYDSVASSYELPDFKVSLHGTGNDSSFWQEEKVTKTS